jgi:thioredoxin reductase (NADPH)
MSSIPGPDEQTQYSSRRHDGDDALAWPVFSEHALDLLRSAGEVLHPEPGEVMWDAGDPYDLYLVLSGGVLLLDRRDDRVVFVIEEGDFVGELGMLMGQRAFLPGVAVEGTAVLRVPVEELRRLVEISGELSDVLLSAFDARRRMLARMARAVSCSLATTTATCTGSRSSQSATSCRTGQCCVRTRRPGQSWRKAPHYLRRVRLW